MNAEKETTKKNKSESNKEEESFSWSPAEKESAKRLYNCEILIERCSISEAKKGNYPNDAYLVSYESGGKLFYDLTRAHKRVNIFDMYWDKFKTNFKGIDFAFGKINPKLWGQKPEKKKKK
jgi:hypothetical protein